MQEYQRILNDYFASQENQATAGAMQSILAALPPALRQNGIQLNEFEWYDPSTNLVYYYEPKDGAPAWRKGTAGESKATLDAYGGGAGGGTRLVSDDERYWDIQYRQLENELLNMGLDRDAARQQALATLIANRNNLAGNLAETSLSAAKTAAEFAANPRDAVAELLYRNQVGGTTPFGDLTNDYFGQYGKTLAEKAASIFSPVQADINQARLYRDAIPLQEFLGQSGQPTAAPAVGAALPAVAPANGLQLLLDRLNSFSEQEKNDFRRYVTGGQPVAMAKGGSLDFEPLFKRDQEGFSPSSSEGGTNLNIHERALIVGESGQVYATLGEKRPDGTIRSENLQIKPLKSEVEKDKKLQEENKAVVESQKKTLASFQLGGTVNATPDDFMEQLRQYLGSLGGSGGGTGAFATPLPSPRLLAGAPYETLLDDPDALAYAQSGYSALGISPENLAATIRRFTPKSAQLVGQTMPRVNFA